MIPWQGNERCCLLADATDGYSIRKDRHYAWWLVLASLLSFHLTVQQAGGWLEAMHMFKLLFDLLGASLL
jgi:hypothetical protein